MELSAIDLVVPTGYPKSLVKGIMGDYGLVHSPALEYGRNTESVGRCTYESFTGNIVDDCGLFIHPEHNFIGASPDGVISDVSAAKGQNKNCCNVNILGRASRD